MRRNTRLITLVMLVIMLISISISGAAKETLTFVYWQDPAAGPIWKEIIDGFEKENPDIEVKAIVNPADYWTKVLTMVAAGQAPDLMMVDYA
ncbi:MAG: extracellular solute-binding protein, partial [Firmicutes bacterium]|nr:extracellular solute-binding protein [Bacillota bacterium]